MSLKKKAPKQKVADYLLSMHIGVCLGVTELRKLTVGEKTIWEGNLTSNTTLTIDKPDLFGGSLKEGGVEGAVEVLMGAQDQVMSSTFASRFGLIPATSPAFRGLFTLFFRGGTGGFKWGTNSPYIKAVAATLFRQSASVNPAKSIIETTVYVADDPATTATETASYIVKDSNAADVVYEALVDTEWGSGASTLDIDPLSFLASQSTLYDEKVGISMMWTRQSSVEAFIQEVLSHINAMLFVDPKTGLWNLKLIRADYDESTLRQVNPDNCQMTSFQRKSWGDTINEVVVTWTNPANEKEETVTAQDIANVGMQGSVVSDSRNYYGFRSADLAMKAALRDVRTASAPLATAELVLNRSFWDIVPGECIKLYWPEEGISGLVMRVMRVNYGKPGDSKIKISVIEDIFSLQEGAFVSPPRTQWVGTSKNPVAFTNVKFMGTPYYFLESEIGSTDAEAVEYPETSTMVLATAPNEDTFAFELLAEAPEVSGALIYQSSGDLAPISASTLSAPLVFGASSVVAFGTLLGFDSPEVSTFCVIGAASQTDSECEIGMVTSVGVSTFTVQRGLFDTIPRAWAAGTPVWFFNLDSPVGDTGGRVAGATTNYKLISKTSLGALPEASAPIISYLQGARPILPIRPANVQLTGVSDGVVNIPEADALVSWANRNRSVESSPPMAWTSTTTTPEVGQSTTVYVEDIFNNVVATHSGLTGTSFSIPLASFGMLSGGFIRVSSMRDGHESLQAKRIGFNMPTRSGYGFKYGKNYGGA